MVILSLLRQSKSLVYMLLNAFVSHKQYSTLLQGLATDPLVPQKTSHL